MRLTTRREFLQQATAGGAATFLLPALGGLVHSLFVDLRHGSAPRGLGDYGPLSPAGSELALPEGFAYRVIGREGALMTGGAPTPRAHDGMAAFGLSPDGRVLFVNLQGDTAPGGPGNPGMTFAIWGPWEDGAL